MKGPIPVLGALAALLSASASGTMDHPRQAAPRAPRASEGPSQGSWYEDQMAAVLGGREKRAYYVDQHGKLDLEWQDVLPSLPLECAAGEVVYSGSFYWCDNGRWVRFNTVHRVILVPADETGMPSCGVWHLQGRMLLREKSTLRMRLPAAARVKTR